MTAKHSQRGELQTLSITFSLLSLANRFIPFSAKVYGQMDFVIIFILLCLKSSTVGWTVHVLF